MKTARQESLRFLLPLLLLLVGSFSLSSLLPAALAWIVTGLLALACAFVLYFFRDPYRASDADEAVLTSAADGLVTHVERLDQSPFDLGPCLRVSVFLSVFDVHVNRVPWPGIIKKTVHTPGKFLDVRDEASHLANEHQDWLLETGRGPVVIRQIAGLIARRIVPWKKAGDEVYRGEHLGMIRFGSRTDLFLPVDCSVLVQVGDRVKGAETPIARWP
ncbi:MAG: phosphatidylserine decarboxylase [Verrucomicrobium sp.]|nr:phosphatidylserine decarboxylase [Verrucomicrobium sp.]